MSAVDPLAAVRRALAELPAPEDATPEDFERLAELQAAIHADIETAYAELHAIVGRVLAGASRDGDTLAAEWWTAVGHQLLAAHGEVIRHASRMTRALGIDLPAEPIGGEHQ